MLNRKMHTIKKGGYTLFSDKTRKMLLSAGMSLLSVFTLANVACAKPVQDGMAYYKECEGYRLYQISAKEDADFKLSEIILVDGEKITKVEGKDRLFWKVSSDGKELLAVIKVQEKYEGNDYPEIRVRNNDTTTTEDPKDCIIGDPQEYNPDEADKGPKVLWAYKNEEENYVIFGAKDDIVISDLVGDNDVTVNIEEKDKGTDVIAKYVLKEGEDEFSVRNIFCASKKISIDEIPVTYTIAAKNTDGQKVVLNIKLPEGAELKSLKTVEGVNILVKEAGKTFKSDEKDDLVAVYTEVPEGTTYLDLTYRLNGTESDVTIPIALKLDLKAPNVVQRNEDGDIVDANGTARVYKNETCTKALVEVTDMISGIAKIAVYKSTEECKEATQKFDIKNLPTSVLQLMDLPSGATNIKIYDGMGNIQDISLDKVQIDEGSGLSLNMEVDEDNGLIVATYKDNRAGLHKFIRTKESEVFDKEAVCYYEENFAPRKDNGNGVEVDDLYKTLQKKSEIKEKYVVKEVTSKLGTEDWQGAPEFTVLNILGNTKEFSINKIMFGVDAIYMATSGDKDNPVVKAMAVKAHDARRIKKITATINGEEKTLDTFEVANGGNLGPTDVEKVYELPEGSHVTKVTFYHYYDIEGEEKVTQNEIPVDFTAETGETPEPEIEIPIINIPEVIKPGAPAPGQEPVEPEEDPRLEYVEIEVNPSEIPSEEGEEEEVVTVKIKYGIKKIEYSDGCILEFYEDFPKEVEVYTKDDEGNPLESVIITDVLGYTYDVADGSQDIVTFSTEA